MADGYGATAFTTIQAPTAGIYVPVPPLNDAGGPLVIDMKLQLIAALYIQVTCEITEEQVASGDPREGIYYVFAANSTDIMVGLPGDYQYDMTALVPDVIGIGFSAREVAPVGRPYLLLMSRTELDAEARIRVS
jgi:hypothetical protein